ncbi:MAG: TATA-binding protein-associated factor mot1 [Bogoriella megaspora]|nr:MAG: TATA-binding protein-associated factor mot1 [Bogoriella megaspora]
MASRLDRLVTLLEKGSTPLIRNTAATQLADVQKQHPDELFNLLSRVVPYLRTKGTRGWDARVAAAKAIGGIVENAEKFDPNADDFELPTSHEIKSISNGATEIKSEEETPLQALHSDDQFELSTLDVTTILTKGKQLLGSDGKEYDYKLAAMDPASRLEYQKKTLVARLGVGGEWTEFNDAAIGEMDINATAKPATTPGLSKIDTSFSRNNSINTAIAQSPKDVPAQTPGGADSGLSKRQLNMLKRKKKTELKGQANKVRLIDFSSGRRESTDDLETPVEAEPRPVKMEVKRESTDGAAVDYFNLDRNSVDDETKVVTEYKGPAVPEKSTLQTEDEEKGLEWPYEKLCDLLMVDMFDHTWEVRHGSAMALREIIRVHGAGAGRRWGKARKQNDELNRRWLDDLACRICCIFMLDRFGDYVSDTVVAPIRETAGQVLGVILPYLPPESIRSTYYILYKLVMQEDLKQSTRIWQACHGGMIGMRYLVAVRSDLLLQDNQLLDGVLEIVMKGLVDSDDDVRAVSAATLQPVVKEFVNFRPSALNRLIHIVWDCLENLSDDLSASTGSVMDLLAKLCSFPEVLDAMKQNAAEDPEQSFTELVPRLYPFFRHAIATVRSAVLRALMTFLEIEGTSTKGWVNGKVLRLIYQNMLVERNERVLKESLQVWNALVQAAVAQGNHQFANSFQEHLQPLITTTIHPIGTSRNPIPMDPTLFIRPSGLTFAPLSNGAMHRPSPANGTEPSAKKQRRKSKKEEEAPPAPSASSPHNIDGDMMTGDVDLVPVSSMIRCRIYAAQALGRAMALWPSDSRHTTFGPALLPHLKSTYSTTRLFAAMVAEEYAVAVTDKDKFGQALSDRLSSLVEDEPPTSYSDLVHFLRTAKAQCTSVINTMRENGLSSSKLPQIPALVQGEPDSSQYAFSIAMADKILNEDFEKLKKSFTPAQRIACEKPLADARDTAKRAIDEAKAVKEQHDVRIRAAAAAAVVAFRDVPKKISGTIKAMMDSVKTEENAELQKRAATAVVRLIEQLSENGKLQPVNKISINLVKFCCAETSETPEFHPSSHINNSILSLMKDEHIQEFEDAKAREKAVKAAKITRRGAKEALEQLCDNFGAQLFHKCPALKDVIETPIRHGFEQGLPHGMLDPDDESGQKAVDALSTLRALVPKFHPDLHGFVLELMSLIVKGLHSKLAVLRYAAAKCFATICSVMTVQGITVLVKQVLPSISNAVDIHVRQGAIECVYHLIHVMEDGILPYVIFLLVPILGRMSDSDDDVRLIATTTFAHLVKLVPLEAGIEDPPGLSKELLEGRDKERKFIAQMLDPKKVEPFQIPVAIKAELRSYQQDGVNWLAFLNRYHLHGILCDDMGLGKTLQTLCIVASDHHMRSEEYAKTGSPDARRLPSLIVCPPSLSGHWTQEIQQFAPFLTVTSFVGVPGHRHMLKPSVSKTDIVITTYDVVRKEADFLASQNWNYCVLDEGHLIKNSKTKLTEAVKRLKSNHRLILSGTPIQNNVLELWSLFDFLMPGFLGTEKVFHDRFAKPIAASRFAKSSSKEQEAGALAIEALHKQVLPFLLRRLKEEVLKDLPPKILQNYYCDLSDLQRKLFDEFTKKEGAKVKAMAGQGDLEAKQHIFQALQYMRKLCNTPAMVLTKGGRQYSDVTNALEKSKSPPLTDPIHAPKLGALKDLLVDCGIGVDRSAETSGDIVPDASEAVAPHRALIFCQMKEMLDTVSNFMSKYLPMASKLRLDGSVEASQRQNIVNKFNSDPSYDCLLLTTTIGGLGLNLTGADTVIFVEHDWNPQKDLQAMDRAHRIGQKRVVNVYRLVTRGTVEEKIMNLQRFKIDMASTVVNQQNAGLGTMGTDQILDLFTLDSDGAMAPPPGNADKPVEEGEDDSMAVDATGEVREKGKKGFLDELGELWDERQYEEEYDLEKFLMNMNK